jgi:hypothetical protein
MAASSYPETNPFPLQATASVETIDTASPAPDLNIDTDESRAAWHLAQQYIQQSRSSDSSGGVLAIYGAAGTGKTHTLQHILRRVTEEAAASSRLVGTAYVLAGSSEVTDLRFSILRAIPLETLRIVCQRFVATIGREVVVEQSKATSDEGRRQQRLLRDNLEQIGELIRSAFIDPDTVNKRQGDALRFAGNDDIRNALSYIDDVELGLPAYRWLCGEAVDAPTLLRLGVTQARASDHSHRALRVMVHLFQRTGTPLLILIDQGEAVLRALEGEPLRPAGIELFQILAELLPKEHAFLAVAMEDRTWRALPVFLKQRFTSATIELSVISLKTARDLVHLYVRRTAPRPGEPVDVFPFDDASLKEILSGVGGNLRLFLQTCHKAFELAAPGSSRVSPDTAREALHDARRPRPTLPQVANQIDAIVRDRGFELQGDAPGPSTMTRRLSHLITQRGGGAAVARLEISESLFADDEARQSVATVDVVKRAHESAQRLPVIIVVVGYVSPEILRHLREVTPHVVVHADACLRLHINEVLDKLSVTASAVTAMDLTRLRDELFVIFQARRDETQQTSLSAEIMLRQAERTRLEDIWRTTRSDWVDERRRLKTQLKEARRLRSAEELRALDWERRRAYRERVQRLALSWVAIGIGMLVVLALCISDVRAAVSGDLISTIRELPRFVVLPFTLAVLGALVQLYGVSAWRRALWNEVSSFQDLDRLSARMAKNRYSTLRDLESENPQLRYAAVSRTGLAFRSQNSHGLHTLLYGRPLSLSDLESAAPGESNATVRRALALDTRLSSDSLPWAERIYAMNDAPLAQLLREFDASDEGRRFVSKVLTPDSPVARAISLGVTPTLWHDLRSEQAELNLPALLMMLSPFERPGLGTFDYLKRIEEVDNLYLFVRQWQFFVDRDMPTL